MYENNIINIFDEIELVKYNLIKIINLLDG